MNKNTVEKLLLLAALLLILGGLAIIVLNRSLVETGPDSAPAPTVQTSLEKFEAIPESAGTPKEINNSVLGELDAMVNEVSLDNLLEEDILNDLY